MAIKVMLERYTAATDEVLTVLHRFNEFFPKGQYLVRTSMAVSGIVQLSKRSDVAKSPIRIFRADFLSSRLLARATKTKLFPRTAIETRIE